jgi:hypothetical protein
VGRSLETSMDNIARLCLKKTKQNKKTSQEPVAHTCNPSYPGGRNQEDQDLKLVQANYSPGPISKKPITKKGLVEWLKV